MVFKAVRHILQEAGPAGTGSAPLFRLPIELGRSVDRHIFDFKDVLANAEYGFLMSSSLSNS